MGQTLPPFSSHNRCALFWELEYSEISWGFYKAGRKLNDDSWFSQFLSGTKKGSTGVAGFSFCYRMQNAQLACSSKETEENLWEIKFEEKRIWFFVKNMEVHSNVHRSILTIEGREKLAVLSTWSRRQEGESNEQRSWELSASKVNPLLRCSKWQQYRIKSSWRGKRETQ